MAEREASTTPRFAVVGCGAAGQLHVDALERAGLAPAALIDPDATRRAALSRQWPDAVVARSPAEATDHFDVGIVATPDALHPPLTIELLESGKDVLVEKPMAVTRSEAHAMVSAADASGRVLAISHARRCLPVKAWAFEVLRSGVLGEVERVDIAQGGRDDWTAATADFLLRSCGGAIAVQGTYAIDLLVWWFGPLDVLSCTDDARGWLEADATIELCAGDIPVHLEVSRIRSKRNTIRVHTERGVLEIAIDHFQPQQVLAVPGGLGIPPFDEVVLDLAGQFDRQLQAFLEALSGLWSPLLSTPADGAEIAGVLEDCYACRSTDEPWWMRSAVTGS